MNKNLNNDEVIQYVENLTRLNLSFCMNEALNHYEAIQGIASKYYSQFIPEQHINHEVPRIAMNYIVTHVCTDKERIPSGVENYIETNYGIDYMTNILTRSVSDKKIRILILDDLFASIKATTPYSQVSDLNYWLMAANKVKTNLELQHYTNPDHLTYFVETYAADWKEQLN